MEQDYLIIAVDPDEKFAIRFVSLEHAVRDSIALHRIGTPLTNVFSEHLIASVLLGSRMDEQESHLYKLILSSADLTINCEVSPLGLFRSAIFPPEKRHDYKGGLGGEFKVVRLKVGNTLYESITAINPGGVTQTFNDYLLQSAQRFSILRIDNNQHQRGHGFGLWIEKLPLTSESDFVEFVKNFHAMSFFQDTIDRRTDPDQIMQNLFPGGLRILAVTKPKLTCSCDKQRFLDALVTLPISDLTELFLDGQGVTSQCDYCHKVWDVTDDEMRELLQINSTKH